MIQTARFISTIDIGYKLHVKVWIVEFSEFGFDDCRNVEVIVGRVVGDIPGSVVDDAKDFGLETLDALDVDWLA